MLLQHLFQLQLWGPLHQVVVEGVQRGGVGPAELLNTPATAALGGLGHEHLVGGQKRHHLFPVVPGHWHPVPVQVLAKESVELHLVVKLARVGLVVVLHHQGVVAASGEVGVPLLRCEIVHLKQVIVHIPRPVLHGAVLHVPENGQPGPPGLFVDGANLLPHGLVVHIHHALE